MMVFNSQLYEHTDGVAIGSPLGPLLANVFMCSIEETLKHKGKMSTYYRLYVDDKLRITRDKVSADNFLHTLNHCHSSVMFTKETEKKGMLLFLNTQLLNKSTHTETNVYVKPTNSGLLLQYLVLNRTLIEHLSNYTEHLSVDRKLTRLRCVFTQLFNRQTRKNWLAVQLTIHSTITRSHVIALFGN